MNPTDQHLATLFRDASSDLSPDVTELVVGGIARGRRQRRRQGVGTALAAVAVIGVIGVAASVAPGPGEDASDADVPVATEGPSRHDSTSPQPEPPRTLEELRVSLEAAPDAELAVPAREIPVQVAALLPPGDVGPVLTEHPYPVVNEPDTRIVHFRWNGTLTTFSIEPARNLGTCVQFAQQSTDDSGGCQIVDGLEVLSWPATTNDQVTAQGVMVWQHGYVVSALSYNAPDGKDVAPTLDAPPISMEELTGIASSEVWFSAS